MKKQIFTLMQLVAIAGIIVGGMTVFADFSPADQTTNGPKPVDLGENNQTIKSAFGSRKFLKAGTTVPLAIPSTTASPTWNDEGVIVAEKNVVSPHGILQDVLLPGKRSQVKIGSTGIVSDLPATQPFTGDTTTPLIIDMRGRGTTVNDRAGREAIELVADQVCNAYSTLKTNTRAVELLSTRNSTGKADIIARQLQLNEPNAGAMKVLVATDTLGNAVWGTMEIVTENGIQKIKVNYPGSPVADGQNSCGGVNPPQLDLCTNIAGNQATVPTGMVKDTPGTTPGVCTTPPADMCPNITGTQTSIPAGMALDTNGNCVTDMCPNITGPQSTVPAGYYVDGSGSCLTLRYWTCAPQGVNGWFESKPPGNNYNLPVKIANTSSPYFNTPYCSVANYRPGDKYYRQYDSICAEHSVTPDTSACYPTGNTPIAPSCTGTTYSQPCNP